MDVVADGMTVVVTLKKNSKSFAGGKGGLSHEELARATQLGSDALARCLTMLASQHLVTSAVTDEHIGGRRLFYLTRAAIERFLGSSAD